MCKLSSTSVIRNEFYTKCDVTGGFLFIQGIRRRVWDREVRGKEEKEENGTKEIKRRRRHPGRHFGVEEVSCGEECSQEVTPDCYH